MQPGNQTLGGVLTERDAGTARTDPLPDVARSQQDLGNLYHQVIPDATKQQQDDVEQERRALSWPGWHPGRYEMLATPISDVKTDLAPTLPTSYAASGAARSEGYSWDEINQAVGGARQAAQKAGYSDPEINEALGHWSGYGAPPQASTPFVPNPADDAAATIRSFGQKYLTPSIDQPGYAPPPIKTAGDFFKALGWDVVDVGRMFGQPVVNGVAAILEGLDGRIRTTEENVKLGAEAEGFLGLLAHTSAMPLGAPKAGFDALKSTLPPKQDMLDAATALAKTHPDGLTPETLTTAAQALGQHYVATGENPVQAVASGAPLRVSPEDRQSAINDHGGIKYDPQAVQTPEVAAQAVADNPALTDDKSLLADESGELRFPPKQPLIDPQTIGVPNPNLADGLVRDIKMTFSPQSLAPEAAGVIRSRLAQNALDVARSATNLRRFGRAVGELSSVDRMKWFDAYETGKVEESQFGGTPMGEAAKAIHGTFEGDYADMERLGIAPDYVENYIGHLFQKPEAAQQFIAGRRPLEGSKSFTKERKYDLISQAVAAGHKLITDDPVELALVQHMSQRKYITAHEILNDLDSKGLTARMKPGEAVPPGLTRINDKIATTGEGTLYAPDAVAQLINRHLSPGYSGRPAYDAIRSFTNFTRTLKLMGSAFHPVILGMDAIAGQLGLATRQIERGVRTFEPLDVGRGLANVVTSPAAPFINAYKGAKYINQAISGKFDSPMRATVTDAMVESGTRFQAGSTYHTTAGNFWSSFKSTLLGGGQRTLEQEFAQIFRDAPPVKIAGTPILPAYARAVAQVAGRAMDTLSAPIMDVMVPHMKVGAIASEMEDLLRAHPNLTGDALRIAGGKIVDQVDRRLGEMIQDNLFWHKGFSDLMQAAFLAPEWWLGKLQLMGAASADLLKGGYTKVAPGEARDLSRNLTYLVGAVGGSIMAGATYGYLHGTWNSDWSFRDYMYPPTGGTDAQGGKSRASLPNILEIMYGMVKHPEQALQNKLNGIWQDIPDLLENLDYRGAAIRKTTDSIGTQAGDVAKHILDQFKPIIASPSGNSKDGITLFEHYLGLREAPYEIREPDKEEKYQRGEEKKALKNREKERAQSGQ